MQKHFFFPLSVLYFHNTQLHHKVQTFGFSTGPKHIHTHTLYGVQTCNMAKCDYVDAVLDSKGLFPAGKRVLIFDKKWAYTFKFHIKTHNAQELLKQ